MKTISSSQKAHAKVAQAISKGILINPKKLRCEDCGKKAHHYDHRDYLKPLKVDPVCRSCNFKRGSAKNNISNIKILSLRMDTDLYQLVKAWAKSSRHSINDTILIALENMLKK